MTKSAMIRARMDPHLKEEAESILEELGISTTQALTIFYQQIRLKKGIPFDVRLPKEADAPVNPTPVQHPSAPFPVHEKRAIMEQNVAAYKAMYDTLIERYLGQFVAICNGKLVDHDSDPVDLLTRVRTDYPNQVVLRQKVELAPERELRIRHPQIEKAP
ncbi:MAG: type II toxin-antitoxin system RelB/DinJ family antitoxin [Caldilineaceae bacterium]|nr:type II toxin-antitoxin system RelB/DinJ family antitoxin [Caldilineaceae bacterium]